MTLEEIKKKLEELLAQLESSEELSEEQIDEIEKQVDELQEEKKSLEAKAEKRSQALAKARALGSVKEIIDGKEERKMEDEKKEYKSAYLKTLLKRELTETEQRAFTSAKESAGAAIPTEIAEEIISKVKDKAPLLKEITLLRVKGNVTFAVESVNSEAAIHGENSEITAAEDKMIPITLSAYEINKLVQVSKSVMTMSIAAFEEWLIDAIAERIAKLINSYIVNGTGSSQPTGINTTTWDETNSIVVAKAATLTAANVQALIALLKSGYDANAKFVMSKKTLFTDFMPLQDNSKNKIVTSEGKDYFVYGYPVILDENVTLHEAFLGDLKKYVGNLSEEINVVSDFDINTNSFKFLGSAMFDGKLALAEAMVKLAKAAE